jgi:hypothetical protein
LEEKWAKERRFATAVRVRALGKQDRIYRIRDAGVNRVEKFIL